MSCGGRGQGLPGGEQHSQAVCRPRQHLHSLVQHLEAALPVAEVRVAVEEQAVERGAERQVVLGTYSGGGSKAGAPQGALSAAPKSPKLRTHRRAMCAVSVTRIGNPGSLTTTLGPTRCLSVGSRAT